MKLGVVFGYWGAHAVPGFVEVAQEAERLGFDSVWVAESWGNDAFTFARVGRRAHRRRSRSAPASCRWRRARRPPRRWPRSRSTTCRTAGSSSGSASPGRRWSRAGTAGRRTSRWPAPASTSRSSAGRCAARGRSSSTASSTRYPYRGEGSVGLGKPLKIMTHPLRARDPDLPRRRGAEERHPDRGDRRRLAAALLLAVPPGGLRRPAGRTPSPASRSPRWSTVIVTDDVERRPARR